MNLSLDSLFVLGNKIPTKKSKWCSLLLFYKLIFLSWEVHYFSEINAFSLSFCILSLLDVKKKVCYSHARKKLLKEIHLRNSLFFYSLYAFALVELFLRGKKGHILIILFRFIFILKSLSWIIVPLLII